MYKIQILDLMNINYLYIFDYFAPAPDRMF